MTLLRHQINRIDRNYFIEKVNVPLLKALVLLSKRYPEPTMENATHPNSRWLLEVQEKYLEYEGLGRVAEAVVALIRIAIAKIEHSPNYRDRISWFVEVVPSGWKGRSYGHPKVGWNEPKPYGGR